MSRYLVIEFDNNDQADALRAQIDAASGKGKPFRVVGLFGKPGRNCQCAHSRESFVRLRTKDSRPVRGAKLGWWVCPDCHRPRFGNQNLTNLLGVGEVLKPRAFTEVDWLEHPPHPQPWVYFPSELTVNILPHRGE